MVIILPPFEDGSLSETVSRMTPEKVQGVMAEIKSGFYKADDLIIQIPKFAIEQVKLSGLKTLLASVFIYYLRLYVIYIFSFVGV